MPPNGITRSSNQQTIVCMRCLLNFIHCMSNVKTALKQYLQSDLSVIQRVYLFNTQKSKRFNTNALTQLVKRLYQRVGIVGASSHSGRRTFITKLATSGVSVRVIAEAVGHSSIATTQRYIDVNDEQMRRAA